MSKFVIVRIIPDRGLYVSLYNLTHACLSMRIILLENVISVSAQYIN